MGAKLQVQSGMVSTICKPGAHIDDIRKVVSELGNKDDRHLVLLVGTNDVINDDSEVLLSKYMALIDESKKVANRKISAVGIPRRADLTYLQNRHRLGVNKYLRMMCEENDVEYIEYEPADSRLARDGLHLNELGQDELGRLIFKHCRSFLA